MQITSSSNEAFCQVPEEIQGQINKLHSIPIDVDYIQESLDNPSHWIYEPNEALSHHRLLLRSNFCAGSRGYWMETNAVRSKATDGWRHHNEFVYPVNTLGKPEAVKQIHQWVASQWVEMKKHGLKMTMKSSYQRYSKLPQRANGTSSFSLTRVLFTHHMPRKGV